MRTIEEKAQAYAEQKFQEVAELTEIYLNRQRRIQSVLSFGISNVNDEIISDPARLLTQHSMTPFWIEDCKRARLNNAIFDLEAKICAILEDFEYSRLTPPAYNYFDHYGWERAIFGILFEEFFDLEGQIKDLLAKFIRRSASQVWELWECHGFNDAQYIKYSRRQREVKHRSELRKALYADIYSMFSEQTSISEDDLPF